MLWSPSGGAPIDRPACMKSRTSGWISSDGRRTGSGPSAPCAAEAAARKALAAAERRQQRLIGPTAAARLGPDREIVGMAAHMRHGVDGARPADDAARAARHGRGRSCRPAASCDSPSHSSGRRETAIAADRRCRDRPARRLPRRAATESVGSSESRAATTEPAVPAPMTTTSKPVNAAIVSASTQVRQRRCRAQGARKSAAARAARWSRMARSAPSGSRAAIAAPIAACSASRWRIRLGQVLPPLLRRMRPSLPTCRSNA